MQKKGSPPQNKGNDDQQRVLMKAKQTIETSGPIPGARELAAYRQVREDLPDIIISAWLKETDFRHELDDRSQRVIEKASQHAIIDEHCKVGIAAAFVFISLAFAGYLIFIGEPKYAVLMASLPAGMACINSVLKFFTRQP